MNIFHRASIATSCMVLCTATAFSDDISDPSQGELVIVPASELFVPNGYDDNDEVVLVLDGVLPDTCHKIAYNEAKLTPPERDIRLVQYARKFEGPCLSVLVPYFTEARVGILPKGQYGVVSQGAQPENLRVQEASNAGPDDYTYAPIETAHVVYSPDLHRYVAILEGRRTSACMELRNENIQVIDHGKTIEVLPVMDDLDPDQCTNDTDLPPIKERILLPEGMSHGRHLLHVRSLNGKSVNQVFTVSQET